MALRGGRTISKLGLHPDAIEDAARRWRTSAVFNLPDGRRQHIISGPMHYWDGVAWQEIDNRWQPAVKPWDYAMPAAEYRAYLLKRLSSGQILRLEKAGHYLTFQPMALGWTNDDGMIQQIAMPAAVDGVVSNSGEAGLCQQGRIDWPNGYGNGRDFAYIPSTHFFKKLLTVDSLAALGTPAQYILDRPNPALSLDFIFTSDLDLYVDGELWDRSSRRQTASRIEFRDGETLHWWWGVPRATGANGDEQPGTIELRKAGPSLYVSVRVPWEWLETAIYPVEIDPDTYYGHTDDGFIGGKSETYATARSTATDSDSTGSYTYPGQRYAAPDYRVYRDYLKFDTSGIDDGATVESVYLYRYYTAMARADEVDLDIYEYNWIDDWGTGTGGNRETDFDNALGSSRDRTWLNTAVLTAGGAGYYCNAESLNTSWVNKTGDTLYAMLSAEDVASSEPTGYEYASFYTADYYSESKRPYLSITEGAAGGTVARHLTEAYMRSR